MAAIRPARAASRHPSFDGRISRNLPVIDEERGLVCIVEPARCGASVDGGGLRLGKVQRRVAVDGRFHEIAYALRADGTSEPGWDLMTQLENKRWPDGRRSDDHQPNLRRRLLAIIQYLAENGEIDSRGSYNSLGNGLWELKVEDIRLTFYDTDDQGSWDPKLGESVSVMGRNVWILPEDFEVFIRLGLWFEKVDNRALPSDIDEAHQVRMEDIDHDRIIEEPDAD